VYVTAPTLTVAVAVDEQDRIVTGPPIVRRFRGQELARLTYWLRLQGGGVSVEELPRAGQFDAGGGVGNAAS
jgi:hypothetical protein